MVLREVHDTTWPHCCCWHRTDEHASRKKERECRLVTPR